MRAHSLRGENQAEIHRFPTQRTVDNSENIHLVYIEGPLIN